MEVVMEVVMELVKRDCRRECWRCVGVLLVLVVLSNAVQEVDGAGGSWRVITKNAGITSMHTAVTHLGTVVLLHHTDNGPSNITFEGRCRDTTYDLILKHDCFGHSVLLDPNSGQVRPLMVLTNTFCSSGQFLADGTLQQTGGDNEGVRRIRTLAPKCFVLNTTAGSNKTHCDWVETAQNLTMDRWYASNAKLADGRQIVVGGRSTPFVELVPPTNPGDTAQYLPFINSANILPGWNNLYPYVHVLPTTGYVWLFAGRDSIIYNYLTNTVVRTFDKIPGGARNYPSGGSSVMLPLTYGFDYQKVEIVVCGGASNGSQNTDDSVNQIPCQTSCGRIEVTKPNSTWVMEDMPIPRCMGDMVTLPDTNVLIINGAQKGAEGFTSASVPVFTPVLYNPQKNTSRFSVLSRTPTQTPRVYHSTANLLPDGSVMVAGSNTNPYYYFGTDSDPTHFPTQLSVEAFTPPYAGNSAGGRPFIMGMNTTTMEYDTVVSVHFWDLYRGNSAAKSPVVDGNDTFIYTMNSAPWVTHAYSQGQRQLTLRPLGFTAQFVRKETSFFVNDRTASIRMPRYTTVAPPGYYMLWVVKNGNPSQKCIWIQMVL